MKSLKQVEAFLGEFRRKYKLFDIVFIEEKMKNTGILLSLDFPAIGRREIIESVVPTDYTEGPLDHCHFGPASTWVFGKHHKHQEFAIHLCTGCPECCVVCLSFRVVNKSMTYPYKNPS